MEKVQNTWDKRTKYCPQQINSKFFLLGGSDKLIGLVDETPDSLGFSTKSDDDDLPQVDFFQYPTRNQTPKYTDNRPRLICPPPKKPRPCHIAHLRRNPIQADYKWLKVIDELKKNNQGWNRFLRNNLPDVIDGFELDESQGLGLLDMPVEVVEVIVKHLDGLSFLSLASTSIALDNLMWGALGSNPTNLWKFWRKTWFYHLNLNRQQMLKILASYDGILERKARTEPGSSHPFVPFNDALDSNNWEDVCRSFWNLWERLCTGKLQIKNMTTLEEKIKIQILMNSKGRDYKKSDNLPLIKIITQTAGSIIFNVLSPWKPYSDYQYNLRMMEDLDACKMRRVTSLCLEGILYVKLMCLPTFETSKDSMGPGLPRVVRILVGVCSRCIFFTPLQEGKSRQIVFTEPNYAFRNMDPVTAMHEDVIAVWDQPRVLKLYRISMSERGAEVEPMSQLNFSGMLDLWDQVVDYREFYIPTLVQRKGCLDKISKAHFERFDLEYLLKDHYEFRLISLRFGIEIISTRNPIKSPTEQNTEPEFFVLRQLPQYYLENAMELRDTLDEVYSGAQGYGMFVFWNDETVGISWDGLTWMFQTWGFDSDVTGNNDENDKMTVLVSHLEIISPDCFVVAVNGNIVIFNVKKVTDHKMVILLVDTEINPSCVHNPCLIINRDKSGDDKSECHTAEPQLILSPVRTICMNLRNEGLELDLMTFDYDNGEPYLFLILKKTNSMQSTDFFIKRLCFIPEDEEILAGHRKSGQNRKEKIVEPKIRDEDTGFLKLEPKLFDLHLYPKVLDRLSYFQKMKEMGIVIPQPQIPEPKARNRYKGESREHYFATVISAKHN